MNMHSPSSSTSSVLVMLQEVSTKLLLLLLEFLCCLLGLDSNKDCKWLKRLKPANKYLV
jgi:hypothetical protein